MKPLLTLLVLLPCLWATTSVFAADSFLCIGGNITYFIYDKNSKRCRSITEESYNIYIIERHKNKKVMWELRKTGEGDIPYLCDESSSESGHLLCNLMGEFIIFKDNLKFLNSFLDGFCYPTDDNIEVDSDGGRGVSYIEMGRCHPQ